MTVRLLLVCLLLACALPSFPQKKKALVIGINEYQPSTGQSQNSVRNWSNLGGAVNDALSIKSICLGRFGMAENDITLLLDKEATRARVLASLEQLASSASQGDVIFIYYAGHGSQVYNSLSADEADRYDESIVPADAFAGAPDIRDKELNRYFARICERGALLTVIFDSCHSGSGTRSRYNPQAPVVRALAKVEEDARDNYRAVRLEEKGALILSAAQDYQLAKEMQQGHGNDRHGAFTFAFLKALSHAPANESAANIFASTSAIMKYHGFSEQHPVIEASAERQARGLLGLQGRNFSEPVVSVIKQGADGTWLLQGGYGMGIEKGAVLGMGQGVQLEVTEVLNLTQCRAKVRSKAVRADLKPGDLLKVEQWAYSDASRLVLEVPFSGFSAQELASAHAAMQSATSANARVALTTAPLQPGITHTVFYRDGQWMLGSDCHAQTVLGPRLDAATAAKVVATAGGQRCASAAQVLLHLELPASAQLSARLQQQLFDANTAFTPKSGLQQTDYRLSGRIANGGQLEYQWWHPQAAGPGAERALLPEATDWLADSYEMERLAKRLHKVKHWLTLEPPASFSTFPYKLALKNFHTGRIITGGNYKPGDTCGLVLRLQPDMARSWQGNRYLYVYSLEKTGEVSLLFPRSANVENSLESLRKSVNGPEWRDEIALGNPMLFKVTGTASSTDHYLLFTSAQPIDMPQRLEQDAVITRGGAATATAFEKILLGADAASYIDLITPPDWSVQRISVKVGPANW